MLYGKKGTKVPLYSSIDYATNGVYSIPVVANPTKPIVVSNAANSLAVTNTSA
jgi:hypothetical protein